MQHGRLQRERRQAGDWNSNTGRAVIGVSCWGDGVSWPCWRGYSSTYIFKDSKSAGGYSNSWGERGWVFHPRQCCANEVEFERLSGAKLCELRPCFEESQCAHVALSYLCMIRLLSRAGGSCNLWMVHGVWVRSMVARARSLDALRAGIHTWHRLQSISPQSTVLKEAGTAVAAAVVAEGVLRARITNTPIRKLLVCNGGSITSSIRHRA